MSNLTPRLDQFNRNYIINGGMDFWQRGTSVNPVTDSTATYLADRFYAYETLATGAFRYDQVSIAAGAIPENLKNAIKMQCTTQQASVGASEFAHVMYIMEGYDYLPISNGKKVTLSFWVYAYQAGTYCISLRNANTTRTLIKEYTVNSSNTWQKVYVQFTTDTSTNGWAFDNGAGLYISFALATGTTQQTATKDAWVTGNYRSTSSQPNFFSSTSNTFYITGVMLYEGWYETSSFYRAGRTIQDEFNYCQRYYESWKAMSNGSIAANNGSTSIYATWKFNVQKRVASTIGGYFGALTDYSAYGSAGNTAISSMTITFGLDNAVIRAYSTQTVNQSSVLAFNNNNAGFYVDAEL